MSTGDLKLTWSNTAGSADVSVALNDIERDAGLRTAVLISLFLDRRAEDGDTLPDGTDRRGWWADQFAEVPGDKLGSRLWLLARAKPTEWIQLAAGYAQEALQWMVDDDVAERIDAAATVTGARRDLVVSIYRPQQQEPTRFRFEGAWQVENSREAT
jgi:phage gp46-like protein